MKVISISVYLVAALMTTAAAAATASTGPATEVAGVVIDGGPGPKVVKSFPADGASVAGGVLALKIVFNQAMTADGWSYARAPDGTFPDCLGQPRMLSDQRTFVLLCTVSPHRSYSLQINAKPDFANENGKSAKPALLHFSTGDMGVFDMHAALSQAGLTDADEPIMRWRDPDAGVGGSSSAPPDPDAEPPVATKTAEAAP